MPKTGSTTILNGHFGWCTLKETVLHEETGGCAGMARGQRSLRPTRMHVALLGTWVAAPPTCVCMHTACQTLPIMPRCTLSVRMFHLPGCMRHWGDPVPVPSAADVEARPTYVPLHDLTEAQVSPTVLHGMASQAPSQFVAFADVLAGAGHGYQWECGSPYAPRETSRRLAVLQVVELWQDYFVFTLVRDPYSRAVSQYRHCLRRNLGVPEECATLVSQGVGSCAGWCMVQTGRWFWGHWIQALLAHPTIMLQSQELDWDRFCESPLELTKFCARRPDCCLQACVALLLLACACQNCAQVWVLPASIGGATGRLVCHTKTHA